MTHRMVTAITVATMLLAPSVAAADKPVREVVDLPADEITDACGFPVLVHTEGSIVRTTWLGDDGQPVRAIETYRGFRYVLTNQRTGEQVGAYGRHIREHFAYRKNVTRYDSTTDDFLQAEATIEISDDRRQSVLATISAFGIHPQYLAGGEGPTDPGPEYVVNVRDSDSAITRAVKARSPLEYIT